MDRACLLLPVSLVLLLTLSVPAQSADNVLFFRDAEALALGAVTITDAGSGAIHGQYWRVGPGFFLWIPVEVLFPDSPVTVDEIERVEYITRTGPTTANVDIAFQMYGKPWGDPSLTGGFLDGVNDKTWNQRLLKTEPLYVNDYDGDFPDNTWNTFDSEHPASPLVWYDGNGHTFAGFFGAPTLAQVQGAGYGDLWSAIPGSGGDNTPYGYGGLSILSFVLATSTGGNWIGFQGDLDLLRVTRTNGDRAIVHFDAGLNNPVTPVPETTCLTGPCVSVDMDVARTDAIDMRGFSVTFTLSPELELCAGLASVTEGSYLSDVGLTDFHVLDDGGGSYTVDASILGLPCGATDPAGTLFRVEVEGAGPDGLGTISVTDVIFRDCINQQILGTGLDASVRVDTTLPVAIANLAASQIKTGNDGDGTTGIQLLWLGAEPGATVAVYRKGYGDYPEYDDGTGVLPAVPATPALALLNGWALTGVTSSGGVDETDLQRDFYYFVAFVTDSCANVSPPSNVTAGTLNYHLGDVVPQVVAPPFGDNLVDVLDISKLGAHYGTAEGNPLYLDTLDVGPTTDFYVNARPTTDNRIQFEDLMMFAINFAQVSKPGTPPPAPAAVDALALEVPDVSAANGTFEVALRLASTGRLQGVSVGLAWDSSVVEPVAVAAGELLQRQAGLGVLLSPELGMVDAAAFGTPLVGEGILGTVTFRRLADGDPGLALGTVLARDARNRPVTLGESRTTVEPRVTRLLPSFPNPFRESTTVRFSLAEAGPVELRVYDVSGAMIRTLLEDVLPAGERTAAWDGRDARGRPAAAGTYLLELRAEGRARTIRIVRLR